MNTEITRLGGIPVPTATPTSTATGTLVPGATATATAASGLQPVATPAAGTIAPGGKMVVSNNSADSNWINEFIDGTHEDEFIEKDNDLTQYEDILARCMDALSEVKVQRKML